MSKYSRLKNILASLQSDQWRVSFAELERLLGIRLPASAHRFPAWWSNDPSNNAMTKIWLEAGWKSEQVDVRGEMVTFRRVSAPVLERKAFGLSDRPRAYEGPVPEAKSTEPAVWKGLKSMIASEYGEHGSAAAQPVSSSVPSNECAPPKKKLKFEDLHGCMKGTIRIAPGIDLTDPVYTEEEWAEIEAESDRKWAEMFKSVAVSRERK